MLCKNCGREMPIAGKFCPFCGAPAEQSGVNDETAVFTTLPDELNGPIDTSAFDAAMRKSHAAAGENVSDDMLDSTLPPVDLPPVRRTNGAQTAPHTTHFESREPLRDRPYRKPSKGKKGAVIVLVILIIAALIGGGVWFFLSRQPDENLTLAEKYMNRGDFDKALEYYEAARAEAKDPTSIDATIQLLEDFQDAQDYVDNEQYTEAIAALKQLQNRVTDPDSALYSAITDLISKAQSAQAENQFAADLAEAQSYLDDGKYDAAAGKLDSLAADSSLTDEQREQVEALQKKLTEAQETAKRQEEDEQQQQEQKQSFSNRIDSQEQIDQQIASAPTIEDELDMTSTSFEVWDTLLDEMYDYLATVLNADQYAAEQSSYESWVAERDQGAENAASQSDDDTAAQLASASFKLSYTKARCYKLLDLM